MEADSEDAGGCRINFATFSNGIMPVYPSEGGTIGQFRVNALSTGLRPAKRNAGRASVKRQVGAMRR